MIFKLWGGASIDRHIGKSLACSICWKNLYSFKMRFTIKPLKMKVTFEHVWILNQYSTSTTILRVAEQDQKFGNKGCIITDSNSL